MTERLAYVTLLVRDYDEAIEYFTGALGFVLIEDSRLAGGKRWVRVAPPGSSGVSLLLARARGPDQERSVGCQAGGRVAFFIHTADFAATYERLRSRGVQFLEAPRSEPYGKVVVFADLYGNRWDLVQPAAGTARRRDLAIE